MQENITFKSFTEASWLEARFPKTSSIPPANNQGSEVVTCVLILVICNSHPILSQSVTMFIFIERDCSIFMTQGRVQTFAYI